MAQARLMISTKSAAEDAHTAAPARSRRKPRNQRVVIAAIGLAIVLLALGGWATQALRVAR